MGNSFIFKLVAALEFKQLKMKNSLVIIAPKLPPSQGGMERQAFIQAKELVKFYDVTFFSTSRDKDLFANSPVNYLGVEIYEGKFAKEINALMIFFKIIKYISIFKKSKIYIHQFNLLTFLTLILCYFMKKKALIKIANSGDKFDLKIFFERYKVLRIAKPIIDSKKFTLLCLTSQNNLDLQKLKFNKINVLPFRNGVIIDEPSNSVAKNSIMFLGRLEPIKGIDVFMKLAEVMPDYSFTAVGSGSLQNNLISAADRLDNVNYLGEMIGEKVPWPYVDWVILPSETEGMSNVLLEAIANGKGIIATKIDQNQFVFSLTNKIVWLDVN